MDPAGVSSGHSTGGDRTTPGRAERQSEGRPGRTRDRCIDRSHPTLVVGLHPGAGGEAAQARSRAQRRPGVS